MNKLIGYTFIGEKPGLNKGKIYLKFDKTDFNMGNVITYDIREGFMLHVDEVKKDLVICRIVTNTIESYIEEKYLQTNTNFYNVKRDQNIYNERSPYTGI